MTHHNDTAIREAVLHALAELNHQLPANRRLAPADTTALAGPGGQLDSLGVVNLIALVEQKLEQEAGIAIDLLGTELLDGGEALSTVASLVTFISSTIYERARG